MNRHTIAERKADEEYLSGGAPPFNCAEETPPLNPAEVEAAARELHAACRAAYKELCQLAGAMGELCPHVTVDVLNQLESTLSKAKEVLK